MLCSPLKELFKEAHTIGFLAARSSDEGAMAFTFILKIQRVITPAKQPAHTFENIISCTISQSKMDENRAFIMMNIR